MRSGSCIVNGAHPVGLGRCSEDKHRPCARMTRTGCWREARGSTRRIWRRSGTSSKGRRRDPSASRLVAPFCWGMVGDVARSVWEMVAAIEQHIIAAVARIRTLAIVALVALAPDRITQRSLRLWPPLGESGASVNMCRTRLKGVKRDDHRRRHLVDLGKPSEGHHHGRPAKFVVLLQVRSHPRRNGGLHSHRGRDAIHTVQLFCCS